MEAVDSYASREYYYSDGYSTQYSRYSSAGVDYSGLAYEGDPPAKKGQVQQAPARQATLRPYEPDMADRWREGNLAQQLAYNFVDGFYSLGADTHLGGRGFDSYDDMIKTRLGGLVNLVGFFVSGETTAIKTVEGAIASQSAETASKAAINTVTRSESVLGHIFRDSPGHVNPATVTSQNRYIKLFESVGNNSGNLNPNVLTNFQRNAGGFQGYSQTFRNGKQVWVQTLDGKIINAGVNVVPK